MLGPPDSPLPLGRPSPPEGRGLVRPAIVQGAVSELLAGSACVDPRPGGGRGGTVLETLTLIPPGSCQETTWEVVLTNTGVQRRQVGSTRPSGGTSVMAG